MKVRIKHFQSLSDVQFDVEGFTVITGDSDVGKSSIIRAIEAALFNKAGDYFIKDGKDGSGIRLSTGKNEIVWMKGRGGGGSYQIDEKKFTAIGRTQLKEISDLGFKEIDIESAKVRPQVAKQFSPQFLIDSEYSPSVVSKLLGDLSGVRKLALAKKACSKDLSKSKELEKLLQEQLDLERKKLERFPEYESFVIKFKDLSEKYENLILRKQNLSGLYLKIVNREKLVNMLNKIKEVYKPTFYDSILNRISLIEKLFLHTFKQNVLKALSAVSCFQYTVFDVAKFNFIFRLEKLIYDKKLISIFEKCKAPSIFEISSMEMADRLRKGFDKKIVMSLNLEANARDTKLVNDDLNRIIDNLKEFKSCPLCGSSL